MKRRAVTFTPQARDDLFGICDWIAERAGIEVALNYTCAWRPIATALNSRVNEADGVTMKMIVQLAWDITMDELVAGTPKWFDETKYSIVAKTSTAVSGTGQNMNVDIDDLKAMAVRVMTASNRWTVVARGCS